MEAETPQANKKKAHICDQEYCIMIILSTILDADIGKVHEPCICESVYDLSDIERSIVILSVSARAILTESIGVNLFTEIQSRGDRIPISWTRIGIPDRRQPRGHG